MEFTYPVPMCHLPRKSHAGQCRAGIPQRLEGISKVIVTFSLRILLQPQGFSCVHVMLDPPHLSQNLQIS